MPITNEDLQRAISDLKIDVKAAVSDLKLDLKDDIRGVLALLDKQNGRVLKTELKVAELVVIVDRVDAEQTRIRRDDDEDTALAILRQRRPHADPIVAPVAESLAMSNKVMGLLGGGLVLLTILARVIEALVTKTWAFVSGPK